MTGYVEFEFDLPGALLDQLIHVLHSVDGAPLNVENLAQVPEEQGVYQLFLDNELVYIGKTDADAGLHRRLIRHGRKIMHRSGLDLQRVTFKAIRIFVFTAMDIESELIRYYGGVKAIGWNGSGFGSNDPGRERDTTSIAPANYDAQFPVDIDRELAFAITSNETAASACFRLKEALPYTFRYEGQERRSRHPHPDLEATVLVPLSGPTSARAVLAHIVAQLPNGWQATKLPGYVILYKESKAYPMAEIVAAS